MGVVVVGGGVVVVVVVVVVAAAAVAAGAAVELSYLSYILTFFQKSYPLLLIPCLG